MNKNILDKCVVLIGLDGRAKDEVSKSLSQKLACKEVDFRLMEFCPYTSERIETEIELAKRDLLELKTKSKFAVKPARKEKIKNQIAETKQFIVDMQNSFELRDMFLYVPNFIDMGYDRLLAKHLKDNYGEKTYIAYIKKFENKMLYSLAFTTKEPYVLKLPATAANVVQTKEDAFYESPNKNLCYTLYKTDKEKTIKETKEKFELYKNVVYLKQDTNELSTEIEKEFVTDGQFEELATSVVDINGLIDECGKVDEDKLNSITDQIILSIEHNVDEGEIVENNKNNEKAI